jgi:nucleoside-diphosphate-sugar epimerase
MSERPIVIITGSSGLIGSALARQFAERFQVAGLDQVAPKQGEENVTWFRTDMTSEQSVRNATEDVGDRFGRRIESVIHLAAYYDFAGEPSPLYDQITVRGTARLLTALQGWDVGQFVFSSTMLVHAPCRPGQHINEDWPLEPKWDYPKSKADTERLILDRRGDMPVALLRIAGVYDDRCHSIPIANQIQRIRERRMTAKVFPGDTSTGQSFVHLDDLMDSIRAVVDRRAAIPPDSTFLVGEEEPLSYDELQRTLAWLIHGEKDWDTTRIPKAVAKAGAWVQDTIPGVEEPFIKPWMIDLADDHYALDITRARKLLNWSPRRTLRETLATMIDLLKSDPVGFYRENKLEAAATPVGAAAAQGPR